MRAVQCWTAFFLRSISRRSRRAFRKCHHRFVFNLRAVRRDRHWHAMGFLDLKEDFVGVGLGILPAYWFCWRRPADSQHNHIRTTLTILLAFIVWWSFIVGHVMNDIRGFGS